MEDLKKEFEKEKPKLEEINKKVENIIEIKLNSIEGDTENVRNLKNVKNKNDYFINLVDNFDEKNASMYPNESFKILEQIQAYTATATTIDVIVQSSSDNERNIQKDENLIALMDSTGSFTYDVVDYEVSKEPTVIANYVNFKLSLNKEEEIQKNIEFIKNELFNINPDILNDFKLFIQNFYSTKDITSKYQILFGARSMIFNKYIFAFADSNYPGQPNNFERIKKFVFGSSVYNNNTQAVINSCKNLYNKLSGPRPPSAKAGGLSEFEINLLFQEIITKFSNILRLRSVYFSL